MSIPRRHHYVLVTYLSGFVGGDGQLDVLDRTASKSWRQRPEAIAHQRDFYRLDRGQAHENLESITSWNRHRPSMNQNSSRFSRVTNPLPGGRFVNVRSARGVRHRITQKASSW